MSESEKKGKEREQKSILCESKEHAFLRPIIWNTPVQTTLYKIYRPTYYDCL